MTMIPKNLALGHKAKSILNRNHTKKTDLYDQDPWRVFRIMAEFVDGFEIMSEIGPAITLFGSAREKPGSPYYLLAKTIAYRLSKEGYAIITGGGPGLMEAANQGAREAGGLSVGLNIELPTEQQINPFVNVPVGFRYFFIRKVMFIKYASAVIIMPGGMGTMDEAFEVVTLIQTAKIRPFPVILVGTDYWQGLMEWIHNHMIKQGMLSKKEMSVFKVLDDPDEIVAEIRKHRRKAKGRKVNF